MEPDLTPSPAQFLFDLPKFDMVRPLRMDDIYNIPTCMPVQYHINYSVDDIIGSHAESNVTWCFTCIDLAACL